MSLYRRINTFGISSAGPPSRVLTYFLLHVDVKFFMNFIESEKT